MARGALATKKIIKLKLQLNAAIESIYVHANTLQKQEIFAKYIASTCQKDTSSCTFKDAFSAPKYIVGTWIALGVMFWHEMVGNNAIMLYSNQMLDDMSKEGSALTPRQGTYLIGVVNFLSSATSIFSAKHFTRRSLFIWGHFLMGLSHIAVGVFAYLDQPTAVLMSMLSFIFFFQNSSGCITWLYCSEVAVDLVLGFVGFTGYLVVFILTLTTQFMMESETLHAWGTFWLFGGISLVAALWMHAYLKETKGLNDKQKKELYSKRRKVGEASED